VIGRCSSFWTMRIRFAFFRMVAPRVAGDEAWWTGPSGLTINRPLRVLLRSGSAQVAQLVEHATENRSVGGSIPPLGTIGLSGPVLFRPGPFADQQKPS
jgi:hypothetical protein